jgi:hypothetical protein
MVRIGSDGDVFRVAAAEDSALRVLLIAGAPINEEIHRRGPFVLSTKQQLLEAFEDFHNGRMGAIDGADERYAATQAARRRQADSGRDDL